MPPIKRTLAGSFRAAGRGLLAVALKGRNFRTHLSAAAYVVWFALLGEIRGGRLAALLICCALVLCAEAMNTSIELLCDLYSTEHNGLIMNIKDAAAGAVLTAAVFSAVVAAVIFLNAEVLENICVNISENLWQAAAMAAVAAGALVFIFKAGKKDK